MSKRKDTENETDKDGEVREVYYYEAPAIVRYFDSLNDYLKHLTRDTYNYYENELRKEHEYEARTFTRSEDEFVTI